MAKAMRSIPSSPFATSLGITQFDLGDGHARGVIDVTEMPGTRMGTAHGGLLATLLDVTLASAVRLAAPGSGMLGTVNLDIHYLRPGRGVLTADAVALRVGGAIGVARGSVVDAKGATVAVATGSFRITPPSRARIKD